MKAKKLLEYPKKDLLVNWEKLSSLPRIEVEELQKEWYAIYQENKQITEENLVQKEIHLQAIVKSFKDAGVEIYKYKKLKWKTEKNGYVGWFNTNVIKELDKQYGIFTPSMPKFVTVAKTINAIRVDLGFASTLLEGYDAIVAQLKPVKKENKLLDASIAYAEKNNVDISGLTDVQIIDKIDELAKEKYLEENCPTGTQVHLSGECGECDTYIVGERRCECGNRRISIEVDGSILEGFYFYPEGY